MKRIKNNLATDVNEKITKREYIAFGSSTAVSKAATALSGALGGLVASTYMGLSDKSFEIYSTIIFILGFWDIANDVIVSRHAPGLHGFLRRGLLPAPYGCQPVSQQCS